MLLRIGQDTTVCLFHHVYLYTIAKNDYYFSRYWTYLKRLCIDFINAREMNLTEMIMILILHFVLLKEYIKTSVKSQFQNLRTSFENVSMLYLNWEHTMYKNQPRAIGPNVMSLLLKMVSNFNIIQELKTNFQDFDLDKVNLAPHGTMIFNLAHALEILTCLYVNVQCIINFAHLQALQCLFECQLAIVL